MMVSQVEIKDDVLRITGHTKEMLGMIYEGFRRHKLGSLSKVEEIEEMIYKDCECLHEFLLNESSDKGARDFIPIPDHFNNIGKGLNKLFNATKKKIGEDILFSDKSVKEAYKLFDEILILLDCLNDCISTNNRVLARHLDGNGKRLCQLADEFAIFHEERLIAGVCMPVNAPIYLDIIYSFRSVAWHIRRIIQDYFVGLNLR